MRHPLAALFAGISAFAAGAEADAGALIPAATTEVVESPGVHRARGIVELEPGFVTVHWMLDWSRPTGALAWILPVPAAPEVGASSLELFAEVARGLRVELPGEEPCTPLAPRPVVEEGGGCSCGGGTETLPPDPPRPARPGGLIEIPSAQQRRPLGEIEVLPAELGALEAWLSRLDPRGRGLTDELRGQLARHRGSEARFVVLRLEGEPSALGSQPLRVRYPADEPALPLGLLAFSGAPLLTLEVGGSAGATDLPASFPAIPARASELVTDGASTSYLEWVARAVDESNGRLAIGVEIGEARAEVSALLPSRPAFASRFVARARPVELPAVLSFRPHPNQEVRVAPHLDLSMTQAVARCGAPIPERLPSPCGFNYCGEEAECVLVGGAPACRCGPGRVAHAVRDGAEPGTVFCSRIVDALGPTPEEAGEGTAHDPCARLDCGLGRCVSWGGLPGCDCDEGQAALLEDGAPTCVLVPEGAPSFGPGGGPEAWPRARSGAGLGAFMLLAWFAVRAARRPEA